MQQQITEILTSLIYVIPAGVVILLIGYILSLRIIVPTNVVHIVQRGDKTVSYGIGKGSNVYYRFPSWIPKLGIVVRILPVSNFDIDLSRYSAYDKDRVPFVVDVKAFFHIKDTNKAAEKVESYEELKKQLENVVQGSVRSILAKSKLEEIMEERSIFGDKFTENVRVDLENWGVEAIKNIELMDIRDADGSSVIHQIMAKRMSAIEMESRIEVAQNNRSSEQAELQARKEVNVTKADAERVSEEARAKSQELIGIAQADSAKKSGIALQESASEIARAERLTAEQQMEVVKINQIKQAEIDKDKTIINAEQEKRRVEIEAQADKFKVETDASARLEAKKRDAEGIISIGSAEADVIKSKGISEAESKKAMELAGVTAQTTLAKEIGENKSYQEYLIKIREVEVSQIVGVAQYESIAKALSNADLKLLVNSGDVNSGIGKFSDIFTSKGASQLNGLVEGLKQTEEGKGVLSILEKFIPTKVD